MDPTELLPGPHPDAPAVLGGAGLRHPPALRHADGRRHLPPATTLRALGPKPWNAAYVQPSRRPKDGRYGENPNRFQHYYQFQVILKPSPDNIQDLYLQSLAEIGLDRQAPRHPLRRGRLGEPDARRLGPRLGMLVRRHGGEPVHLLPAGRRLRVQPGRRRDHLRPRAPRDVPAGRRQRLRPQLQRRRATTRSPMATSSCRTSRNSRRYNFEVRRHRNAVPPLRRRRDRVQGAARKGPARRQAPPRRPRLRSRSSRPATPSTCSTPAASSRSPSARATSSASATSPKPAAPPGSKPPTAAQPSIAISPSEAPKL